jgi:sialate O-acetylesterase
MSNRFAFCRAFRPGLATMALAIVASGAPAARADVKLPAIFGSHMVLQRDQKDRVWGWADAGEEISVRIEGQDKRAQAGPGGRWEVVLDPMPAGGPYAMTIRGKNVVQLDDVLVGEVWICSGQSNMQWPVAAAKDADLEIAAAKFPNIRLITVPNVGTQEPQQDFRGEWRACRPDTVGGFSAVGYLFGRQLHQSLGVPIGLINDAWGGSACEAWIRRDLLAKDQKFAPLLQRWEQLEKDYSRLKTEFEESRRAAGHGAEAKARAKAGRPPQDPENMMRGNARPGNIYNGVLKPTIGYGIRGVIWYQGESNSGRAYQYRDMFPLMIQSWRDEWAQGDFPFYWAQLADFLAESSEPKDSAWAELREAQTMTLSRLPHTGQAVIIDIGEGRDIHPKDKQDVAMRLARWALARDYGVRIAHQSPTFKSMAIEGNKAMLTFEHVGRGLRAFDVNEPRGFAIAGGDHNFVWAKARISHPDTVEVWSESVSQPVAVRYAWADNPVCNLYSSDGLPATPFRTDDWPGVTIHNVQ